MGNELKYKDIPSELKDEIREHYGDVQYELNSEITETTVSRLPTYVRSLTEEIELPVLNSLSHEPSMITCIPEEGFLIRYDPIDNTVRRVLSRGPQAPLGM